MSITTRSAKRSLSIHNLVISCNPTIWLAALHKRKLDVLDKIELFGHSVYPYDVALLNFWSVPASYSLDYDDNEKWEDYEF